MKKLSLLTLSLFTCGFVFAADSDSKADVKAAAKKLADKGNYSWTATSKFGGGGGGGGNFRPGPTEGQAEGNTIYLKSTFGDRTFESARKGAKVAVQTQDGWESADDLEGNRAFMARRIQTMKAPAEEAQDLAEKSKALKKEGEALSGELTEEAVKNLLSFGPRNPNSNRPEPKNAKGTVKFWVKDGVLSKYEYNVKGTVVGREDQEMEVDRTSTIEIKNAGTTKLTLPEDAKKKLG